MNNLVNKKILLIICGGISAYKCLEIIRGLKKNQEYIMETRKQVGSDYRLMVDCYMSLDVPYAIDLANALREANLFWIEEALPPHDLESHKLIKEACPWQKWTTGEHTNSRYGFRNIIRDFLNTFAPISI